ncbi:histidine phosphatase family protein [Candidatus Wolfebacteria bacterium]|nr:histidine phosphatase family protein [Candidatus Wolfebacteria bacterium]
MKTIYLVRHGESDVNAGPILEGPKSPLTAKGRDQSSLIAERAQKLPIEIIISSTMQRAKETALAIQEKTGKYVEFSDLFIERQRPSHHYGLDKTDPKALGEWRKIVENFATPTFKLFDEENFEDLKKRAREALRHLEDRPENNILVVSHGTFMRVMMGEVLFGSNFTAPECLQLFKTTMAKNTGITVLVYNTEKAPPFWQLLAWNDHAHLG